jgi:hypothetical protein
MEVILNGQEGTNGLFPESLVQVHQSFSDQHRPNAAHLPQASHAMAHPISFLKHVSCNRLLNWPLIILRAEALCTFIPDDALQ